MAKLGGNFRGAKKGTYGNESVAHHFAGLHFAGVTAFCNGTKSIRASGVPFELMAKEEGETTKNGFAE